MLESGVELQRHLIPALRGAGVPVYLNDKEASSADETRSFSAQQVSLFGEVRSEHVGQPDASDVNVVSVPQLCGTENVANSFLENVADGGFISRSKLPDDSAIA